jgi:hypothetical protein
MVIPTWVARLVTPPFESFSRQYIARVDPQRLIVVRDCALDVFLFFPSTAPVIECKTVFRAKADCFIVVCDSAVVVTRPRRRPSLCRHRRGRGAPALASINAIPKFRENTISLKLGIDPKPIFEEVVYNKPDAS